MVNSVYPTKSELLPNWHVHFSKPKKAAVGAFVPTVISSPAEVWP